MCRQQEEGVPVRSGRGSEEDQISNHHSSHSIQRGPNDEHLCHLGAFARAGRAERLAPLALGLDVENELVHKELAEQVQIGAVPGTTAKKFTSVIRTTNDKPVQPAA